MRHVSGADGGRCRGYGLAKRLSRHAPIVARQFRRGHAHSPPPRSAADIALGRRRSSPRLRTGGRAGIRATGVADMPCRQPATCGPSIPMCIRCCGSTVPGSGRSLVEREYEERLRVVRPFRGSSSSHCRGAIACASSGPVPRRPEPAAGRPWPCGADHRADLAPGWARSCTAIDTPAGYKDNSRPSGCPWRSSPGKPGLRGKVAQPVRAQHS